MGIRWCQAQRQPAPAIYRQPSNLSPSFTAHRRQLERLQSSLAASTCQFKQLQLELSARDGEVAALQAEVDSTRKRLHAMQAAQAQAATRDLVALAASDLGLPPDVAQVRRQAAACSCRLPASGALPVLLHAVLAHSTCAPDRLFPAGTGCGLCPQQTAQRAGLDQGQVGVCVQHGLWAAGQPGAGAN